MQDIEVNTLGKRKSRLGRGLGSLLSNDEAAPVQEKAPIAPPSDEKRIWSVPIEKIVANQNQPRLSFDPGKLKELSLSIRQKGILQPITAQRVGKDQFEIISGERRWRAAQQAGLKEVPLILRETDERDSLELALIENIQRHDLNPIDEAKAYHKLATKYSLTQQEIAEKVGKERATVGNSLRLLSLHPEVQKMVMDGRISTGHAKALLSIDDMEKQYEFAKKIVSEKLTVRATESLTSRGKKKNQAKGKDIDLDVGQRLATALSEEMQKLLGTKVKIDYAQGKGKVSVQFYSDDELTKIVEVVRQGCQRR